MSLGEIKHHCGREYIIIAYIQVILGTYNVKYMVKLISLISNSNQVKI